MIETRYVETPYEIDGEDGPDCNTWQDAEKLAKDTLHESQSLIAWVEGCKEGETRRWICSANEKEIMEVENW